MAIQNLSRKIMGVLVLITYFVFIAFAAAQTVNYAPAPTGVPEIDWQNIQNGLDAMGPGETLQLGSCIKR